MLILLHTLYTIAINQDPPLQNSGSAPGTKCIPIVFKKPREFINSRILAAKTRRYGRSFLERAGTTASDNVRGVEIASGLITQHSGNSYLRSSGSVL